VGQVPVDNFVRPQHYFHGCEGRIGADRKGNAHLRQVNTGAPMPNLNTPNPNTLNLENLKKQAKQYLRWHRC
jgi:hypothetical protein